MNIPFLLLHHTTSPHVTPQPVPRTETPCCLRIAPKAPTPPLVPQTHKHDARAVAPTNPPPTPQQPPSYPFAIHQKRSAPRTAPTQRTWWKPHSRSVVCGKLLLFKNSSVAALMFIRGTSGCLSQLKIDMKMYRRIPIACSTRDTKCSTRDTQNSTMWMTYRQIQKGE